MKQGNFCRVIMVKETTRYLVIGLRPFTTYEIQVQSYTAAGSGPQPPLLKIGTTKKVPVVTGRLARKLKRNTEGCIEVIPFSLVRRETI